MLKSVHTVRGKPQYTRLNVHSQAPHLTAVGMTDRFLLFNESGKTFPVWTKSCHSDPISKRQNQTWHFQGFHEQIDSWSFGNRKNCLMNGTDKIRFEYCLGQNHPIPGHSEGVHIGPRLQINVQKYLTDGLITCIILDQRWTTDATSEGGLFAGGTRIQQGRHMCFLYCRRSMTVAIAHSSNREKKESRESFFANCNGAEPTMQFTGSM